MSSTKILAIEDDRYITGFLSLSLKKEGYEVLVAQTAAEGMFLYTSHHPDILLLDLGLPDKDGVEVIRDIRTFSGTPILVISARDQEKEKIEALDAGADDYVTKPFSHRELVARIRAVLRRGQEAELLPEVVEVGDVRMDIERHEVSVSGRAVRLALKEFELLELLLRNAGRVMTRAQLIDRVWGSDYVGDTKTLDVHVKRLRSKIEPDPARPVKLVTVRGLGYKFAS